MASSVAMTGQGARKGRRPDAAQTSPRAAEQDERSDPGQNALIETLQTSSRQGAARTRGPNGIMIGVRLEARLPCLPPWWQPVEPGLLRKDGIRRPAGRRRKISWPDALARAEIAKAEPRDHDGPR